MTRFLLALPLFLAASIACCEDRPPQTAEEWFSAVEARYKSAKTVHLKVETRHTNPATRLVVWYGGDQGYRVETLGADERVTETTICDGKSVQSLDAEGKPSDPLGKAAPGIEAWGRHLLVRFGYDWDEMETGEREIPIQDLKLAGEEEVDGRPCVVLEWTALYAMLAITPIPQKVWIDKETLAIVRRERPGQSETHTELYTDTKFDAEPPADAFRIEAGK